MRWSFLLVVFLFASCTVDSQTSSFSLTGSDGVVARVVDHPEFVYESEEFPVSIEVENRGITEVSSEDPGFVFVSFDPLYLRLVNQESVFLSTSSIFDTFDASLDTSPFFLLPKTQWSFGESGLVTFYFQANSIERFSESVSAPISVSTCYPYETISTSEVCIETSRRESQGACVGTIVRPSTPGAPIIVSSITPRLSVRSGVSSSEFRIVLENVGDGVISSDSCMSDSFDVGSAVVDVSLLGDRLDCFSTGSELFDVVEFRGGRAEFTCRHPNPEYLSASQTNFMSLLSINVSYVYRDSFQTDVEIRR